MSIAKKGIVTGDKNNFFGKKHSEESREKMSRTRKGSQVGELNTKAILDENKVRKIREMYKSGGYTMKYLGEQFGVSKSAVMCIITRRSWKHVF